MNVKRPASPVRSEEIERDGFDFLMGSGSITTIDGAPSTPPPRRRFPFGFTAPKPRDEWDDWLDENLP